MKDRILKWSEFIMAIIFLVITLTGFNKGIVFETFGMVYLASINITLIKILICIQEGERE